MKTIGQTRRENLQVLIDKHGSLAQLNEVIGFPRTDATLSQIKNQSLSASGRPRAMGDVLARRIERALDLTEGWMDNDQAAPTYKQSRIDVAIKAMEEMGEYQLDQAIKIIVALSEPEPKKGNGTHGGQ